MNVGILTFHRAHNCGAMLQNYALQVVLSRMDTNPTTIDFNDIGEEHRIPSFAGLTFRQRIRRVIEFVFSIGVFDLRLARFNRFRRKNLKTTEWIADGRLPSGFDCYIVGSDQVFQPNLTKQYCAAFLLDGIPAEKRISYAASFGYESLPDEYRATYKRNLSLFRAISVREESGARIIKDELGLALPVEVVLDPTLLLDAVDYEGIETKFRVPDKYVLVYSIGGADGKLREVAKTIAMTSNSRVIFVNACARNYYKAPIGDWLSVSPDRLIYLIKRADYVVTTSFHGVAFSLIYQRQFTAIIPKASKVAGRIPALLNRLGIPERAITEHAQGEIVHRQYDSRIDYHAVNMRLEALRNVSLGFLQKALEG